MGEDGEKQSLWFSVNLMLIY